RRPDFGSAAGTVRDRRCGRASRRNGQNQSRSRGETGEIEVRITRFFISTIVIGSLLAPAGLPAAEEVLPKHITPEALKAVRDGLDYLARTQSDDGAWHEGQGGQAYPLSMSAL